MVGHIQKPFCAFASQGFGYYGHVNLSSPNKFPGKHLPFPKTGLCLLSSLGVVVQPVGWSCQDALLYLGINWLYPGTICLEPAAAKGSFALGTVLDQISMLLCILVVRFWGIRRKSSRIFYLWV